MTLPIVAFLLIIVGLITWKVDWYRDQARRKRRRAYLMDLVTRVNAATLAEMKQAQADARAQREITPPEKQEA